MGMDPYAVFRPRRGRIVAVAAAVASLAVFGLAAVEVPGPDEVSNGGWSLADRLLLVLLGVALAAGLLRFALLRAVPSPQGLVVHNLFTTRRLEWAQVLRVQFSGGAPWLTLELDDTDSLAVMAIQKSDGAHAQAEASRMSALVQHHTTPPPEVRER